MHHKYSNILTLVFVSFTHGLALPVLFPIALFGLIVNFFVERISLAYYYKQPPKFDNILHDRALRDLKYAPIFMLLMGYWHLGNRQMFFNEYYPKSDDFMEV